MPQCYSLDYSIEAQQNYLCMLVGVSASEQDDSYSSAATRPCAQWFAYPLNEIRFNHKVFELRSPLTVHLFQAEGGWYCKDEGEHFLAFGDTMERAVHSLCEDFTVYWRMIAEASDEELDASGQAVKEFMQAIVRNAKTE
jgi:hypothetical protein